MQAKDDKRDVPLNINAAFSQLCRNTSYQNTHNVMKGKFSGDSVIHTEKKQLSLPETSSHGIEYCPLLQGHIQLPFQSTLERAGGQSAAGNVGKIYRVARVWPRIRSDMRKP